LKDKEEHLVTFHRKQPKRSRESVSSYLANNCVKTERPRILMLAFGRKNQPLTVDLVEVKKSLAVKRAQRKSSNRKSR